MSKEKLKKPKTIISAINGEEEIIEMIINDQGESQFAVYDIETGAIFYEDDYKGKQPWNPNNNLITSQVLLFPSEAVEYGSNKELFLAIIDYLKNYIELPDNFYNIVAIYCMMTWVFEQFSEVAYLRVLGDPGTGKTRFIKTISHIAYKPMIASGSATPSVLFRIIDLVGGTFVFDEADFQGSDMWKEMIKILNSGHTFGCPVLRSEKVGKDGEYSPRSFKVFGPKVIASRNAFGDEALESRCLTHIMIPRRKLKKAPIALPNAFVKDSLAIRNKLLMYRFKNYKKIGEFKTDVLSSLDPRMQQTSLSVLAVAQSIKIPSLTEEILVFLEEYNEQIRNDRGNSTHVDVLLCVAKLMLDEKCIGDKNYHYTVKYGGIKISDVAAMFNDNFSDEYGMTRGEDSEIKRGQFSPKKIGEVVRGQLKILTQRKHSGYRIPLSEKNKIKRILQRYGLDQSSIEQIKCKLHG